MWCCKCNNDLRACTCPDIDERLEKLSQSPHLALPICPKCGRHAVRCRCKPQPATTVAAPSALICARADSPLIVRGSTLDKTCGLCGARVMMAPSGQAVLKEKPDIMIICASCFGTADFGDRKIEIQPACGMDQLKAEVSSAMPNTWRRRN